MCEYVCVLGVVVVFIVEGIYGLKTIGPFELRMCSVVSAGVC